MTIRIISLLLLSSFCFARDSIKLKIAGMSTPTTATTLVECVGDPVQSAAFQANGLLLQKSPALFQDQPGEPAMGFCALLPPKTDNGEFLLSALPRQNLFTFREESGRLYIEESGRPVLALALQPQLADGVPQDRRRAVYLHPIYDPLQQIITDDFPKDHYHHRGLSWMWPRVTVYGQEYNLWEMQGDIKQVYEKLLVKETGPLAAILGVENKWLVQNRKVMDEWVYLRVFRSDENVRILDLRISLCPLTEISLQGAKGKGYGGLSFRFAPWDSLIIVSPDGLEQEDSNHRRNVWTDLSARFKGSTERSGVAIMQHPGNPDAPAEWCLRHYGFLGVSWPGLYKLTLPVNKMTTLRFRIVLHRGDANINFLNNLYNQFMHTPQIQLTKQ